MLPAPLTALALLFADATPAVVTASAARAPTAASEREMRTILIATLTALGIGLVMLVGALTVHGKHGFFMNWYGTQPGEGYEYHLLALGIALALVIGGGGAWSVDALIAR